MYDQKEESPISLHIGSINGKHTIVIWVDKTLATGIVTLKIVLLLSHARKLVKKEKWLVIKSEPIAWLHG